MRGMPKERRKKWKNANTKKDKHICSKEKKK
jgi:hypothetical protein